MPYDPYIVPPRLRNQNRLRAKLAALAVAFVVFATAVILGAIVALS